MQLVVLDCFRFTIGFVKDNFRSIIQTGIPVLVTWIVLYAVTFFGIFSFFGGQVGTFSVDQSGSFFLSSWSQLTFLSYFVLFIALSLTVYGIADVYIEKRHGSDGYVPFSVAREWRLVLVVVILGAAFIAIPFFQALLPSAIASLFVSSLVGLLLFVGLLFLLARFWMILPSVAMHRNFDVAKAWTTTGEHFTSSLKLLSGAVAISLICCLALGLAFFIATTIFAFVAPTILFVFSSIGSFLPDVISTTVDGIIFFVFAGVGLIFGVLVFSGFVALPVAMGLVPLLFAFDQLDGQKNER